MDQLKERLKELLQKEEWSVPDTEWLLWYLESQDGEELRFLMKENFEKEEPVNDPQHKAHRLLALIHEKTDIQPPAQRRFLNWKYISAAASVMLIAGALTWLLLPAANKKTDSNIAFSQKPAAAKEVLPGRNSARLTLQDGSVIDLDSVTNGVLTKQDDINVVKKNNEVFYQGSKQNPGKVMYHTLSTGRGNQYQLKLSDGSKVWLNAASSIRFPTVFNDKERKVEITGEVYFEVETLYSATSNTKIPFIVAIHSASENMEVQVLGTHFNINAYNDEPVVKTTLAEGRVKVIKGNHYALLQPKQNAVLEKGKQILKVQPANLQKELAWQRGMFEFEDADLHTIMRQIARWYDVDVKFDGAVSPKLYMGSIRREATLAQVFEILKAAGVTYTLKEKTITVHAGK